MEFLESLFDGKVDMTAIVVLSLICAVGMALGKVHVRGVSLGVTFVFFTGILAGHFGLKIDHTILTF
ncbi:MAG: transporter, partial [Alistipes sp.]|nr:transporter [Alistipes sp.]